MYIWDRRSSKYMAIYLPVLELKLVWTITQKITFLSQFICLTLTALLFADRVTMEMEEWSFCWYHCIIKGHWCHSGQEIIFRVQILMGMNVVILQKSCVWVDVIVTLSSWMKPHRLQAKSQKYLPNLQISNKLMSMSCFLWTFTGTQNYQAVRFVATCQLKSGNWLCNSFWPLRVVCKTQCLYW